MWVVLCLPMLFALLGLIFDGGAAIAGAQQADNVADQAARAGADQLDVSAARSEQALFGGADTARASRAACEYVSVALPGASCTVTANADTVTVAVAATVPAQFFGVIGIHQLSIDGSGSADSHTGIDEEVQ
ncbi:pilus assembly protein TadG-related protein [Kineococcus radiotolerans]|uniref:TadE family protein n=1 Tax=Kineococcus radiotolerans (strain ATCC BAA-149 / DSM 14245 / SRS30216) TaxID=266940 RepID=A6WH20_KINRD|nr:pilus assembly protein TadG-related protein [Kineococcus radiotolerans]ABS06109.1 TadE family protein [Kineococcus radiotolerans SRS30216 = ATCC BAA-149]